MSFQVAYHVEPRRSRQQPRGCADSQV